MKKLQKVLSVIITFLMLTCVCTNLFAVNIDKIKGNANIGEDATGAMENIGNVILTYITNAAMILAVVIVAVLGIKYMMGSTEEKAEYKRSMMPYMIGAALVFGASAVGKIVIGLVKAI